MSATTVRRRPDLLWRRTVDRVLVLSGDEVHNLTGPAATVWLTAESPTSLDALHSAIASTVADDEGEPTPTFDDVTGLVDVLIELGVLEQP